MSLQEKYKEICNEYLHSFFDKQGLSEDDYDFNTIWYRNDIGGAAFIDDCILDFKDIKFDVDRDAPDGLIFNWYWKDLERRQLNLPFMSFKNYYYGAKDPISEEDFKKIKMKYSEITEMESKLTNMKTDFEILIKNYQKC